MGADVAHFLFGRICFLHNLHHSTLLNYKLLNQIHCKTHEWKRAKAHGRWVHSGSCCAFPFWADGSNRHTHVESLTPDGDSLTEMTRYLWLIKQIRASMDTTRQRTRQTGELQGYLNMCHFHFQIILNLHLHHWSQGWWITTAAQLLLICDLFKYV